MPPIVSEEEVSAQRYGFNFAWDSPYGHAVKLIESLNARRGLVLDLGCGAAAIAEPLTERGFEYVGADIDESAVAALSGRGCEAHRLDLRRHEELPGQLKKILDGRTPSIVLLLDVIEHMPDTAAFLEAVRECLEKLDRPLLVVSVPNVAHADLGAKLAFGHWDYTPTGLLDHTHLQLFTAERLAAATRACGLLEVGADDFRRWKSDQHFPETHPALSPDSPIAQLLRYWRGRADEHGQTIQFVRAYVPSSVGGAVSSQDAHAAQTPPRSFFTVVMRTQGRRDATLREALTCLAAQTLDDFRVALVVHSDFPEQVVSATEAIVDEFDPSFSARVDILHVTGGGRSRPLNVALDRLDSAYVTFLDDDDVVTANWLESFHTAAQTGAIVRSVGAVRRVAAASDNQNTPFVTQSSLEFRYNPKFDFVYHLWGNDTPICTFAVPRKLIDFGVRFDEQLPILEDWDFLLKCSALAPVRDTSEVTSIYQMWTEGESSASLHKTDLWQAAQRIIQDRADQQPLLLPAGSAYKLVAMCEEMDDARRGIADENEQHRQQLEAVRSELENLRHAYLTTITSRRWRVLGPPARAIATLRRLRGRIGI